jgi:hypothetical protein
LLTFFIFWIIIKIRVGVFTFPVFLTVINHALPVIPIVLWRRVFREKSFIYGNNA